MKIKIKTFMLKVFLNKTSCVIFVLQSTIICFTRILPSLWDVPNCTQNRKPITQSRENLPHKQIGSDGL
jgi:hypothetical protein